MSNAFMASAKKSKQEQATIQKTSSVSEELVSINIRIPKELHRKAQLHRVSTGESMTQLIRRLMTEELR